jgi:hypothetical protein
MIRSPIFVDEDGQRLPTRPCERCGTVVAINRYRMKWLRLLDMPLFRETSAVAWCGHRQEGVPVPSVDREWCWVVPILGEAA